MSWLTLQCSTMTPSEKRCMFRAMAAAASTRARRRCTAQHSRRVAPPPSISVGTGSPKYPSAAQGFDDVRGETAAAIALHRRGRHPRHRGRWEAGRDIGPEDAQPGSQQ